MIRRIFLSATVVLRRVLIRQVLSNSQEVSLFEQVVKNKYEKQFLLSSVDT